MVSMVSSGRGVPLFSAHRSPASTSKTSKFNPKASFKASSTGMVASTCSGPIPSPLIKATL
jgi:hypothetical protein